MSSRLLLRERCPSVRLSETLVTLARATSKPEVTVTSLQIDLLSDILKVRLYIISSTNVHIVDSYVELYSLAYILQLHVISDFGHLSLKVG